MSSSIDSIRSSLYMAGREACWGMGVGYGAAYFSTTLKIIRGLNPMAWALGAAAAIATRSLTMSLFSGVDAFHSNLWVYEIINSVAIPLLSTLAGLWASTYATPLVFTACVFAAGAFMVGTSLSSSRAPVIVHVRVR